MKAVEALLAKSQSGNHRAFRSQCICAFTWNFDQATGNRTFLEPIESGQPQVIAAEAAQIYEGFRLHYDDRVIGRRWPRMSKR